MNLLFYMALRSIPFGLAVATEFSGPLAVALFSSRRLVDFLWLALAIASLGLLLPWGVGAEHLDPEGVLYALAAAVCWGAYIVLGNRLGHLHAGQSVALGLSVAVVSSAIPISLEMVALKRLPKQSFGVMTSMEPSVAALLGLLLLGEHLTRLQWLAVACTMLAASGSSVMARAQSSLI